MDKRPLVVVTRRLPERIETRMQELFRVELWPHEREMTSEELDTALSRAEILVPTLSDHLHRERIEAAGDQLKLIANFGAGTDHIDIAGCKARGILVSNASGATEDDVADIAMTLIQALPRRLKEGQEIASSSDWQGWAPTALLGQRLKGMKLGILGMGRSGRAVAERARAFGLEIHYHMRRRMTAEDEQHFGARYWASFDQMLSNMDILTIHVPGEPSTFHLLNARRIELMKASAFVINTSRGSVVDENALTRAIRQGKLGGAGLDVHSGGKVINPRLKELPNVILLPHMASATVEGRQEMGERVLINIQTFLDGHRPPDLVFA